MGIVVEREKTAAGGEYNLNRERYRANDYIGNYVWPMVSAAGAYAAQF